MKRFSEQLQTKANRMRLSASEKRDLRERVFSYMEYHPLTVVDKKAAKVKAESMFPDPVIKVINFSGWRFLQLSVLTLAMILLVVPYVAERAMPGDMLYAVKVNFNEEVRSTLARNSYDRVVWETERLNRRIAEANLLISEGRMTEEIDINMAKAVRTHNESARREIENLKRLDQEEAVLATIELDTTIDMQSSAMRGGINASSDKVSMTTKIADALSESQRKDRNYDDGVLSIERLMGRIERETTRAHELLESVKGVASNTEQADIKRRLDDIGRKVGLAMQEIESSDENAGKRLLETLQDTQKLIVFMTNIDLRSNLRIDDIMPITLTTEEKLAELKILVKESESLVRRLEIKLETSTGTPEVFAKVKETVELNKRMLNEQIIPNLESSDIDVDDLLIKANSTLNFLRDADEVMGGANIEIPSDEDILKPNSSTTTSTTATTTVGATSTRATSTSVGAPHQNGETGTSTGEV